MLIVSHLGECNKPSVIQTGDSLCLVRDKYENNCVYKTYHRIIDTLLLPRLLFNMPVRVIEKGDELLQVLSNHSTELLACTL